MIFFLSIQLLFDAYVFLERWCSFVEYLTQDLKTTLFDLLYNDDDSWYAELYPRVDSKKLQLALPILSEYLETADLHHVDSLIAHTLATFAEQCSFRKKFNPYPCDEFLWGMMAFLLGI